MDYKALFQKYLVAHAGPAYWSPAEQTAIQDLIDTAPYSEDLTPGSAEQESPEDAQRRERIGRAVANLCGLISIEVYAGRAELMGILYDRELLSKEFGLNLHGVES